MHNILYDFATWVWRKITEFSCVNIWFLFPVKTCLAPIPHPLTTKKNKLNVFVPKDFDKGMCVNKYFSFNLLNVRETRLYNTVPIQPFITTTVVVQCIGVRLKCGWFMVYNSWCITPLSTIFQLYRSGQFYYLFIFE